MAPCGEVRSGTVELRGPLKDFGWDGSERIRDADGTFIATARPDLTKETRDSGVDGELPQLVGFHWAKLQEVSTPLPDECRAFPSQIFTPC